MIRQKSRIMIVLVIMVALVLTIGGMRTAKAADDNVDIEATFPDNTLRQRISYWYDSDGDGFLSKEELEKVTSLSFSSNKWVVDNICSLDGIEVFYNLEELTIVGLSLTELNLSSFPKLKVLDCSDNCLNRLDVSKNKQLIRLDCSQNRITTLNLSANTELEALRCTNNLLTQLNISNATKINELFCSYNQLTELDVRAQGLLEYLSCGNNRIRELDVSKNKNLNSLYCSNNMLTKLVVSGANSLTYLTCFGNRLTNLDVSAITQLRSLECYDNQLTSLSIGNTACLYTLDCHGNRLSALSVSGIASLEELDCSDNQLTSLNVKDLKELVSINCYNNQLTTLTTGRCVTELNCHGNPLQDLKISSFSFWGGRSYYIPAGTRVTIEIPADEGAAFTYQWQQMEMQGNQEVWTDLTVSGAKTRRLIFTMRADCEECMYRCVKKSADGTSETKYMYGVSAAPVFVWRGGDIGNGCDDLSYYKHVGETFTASAKAVGAGGTLISVAVYGSGLG